MSKQSARPFRRGKGAPEQEGVITKNKVKFTTPPEAKEFF